MGVFPYGVTVADIDSDGRRDLAVVNAISNSVSVLLANSSGGFGARTDFATGATPFALTARTSTTTAIPTSRPRTSAAAASRSCSTPRPGPRAGSFGAKTDFATGAEPSAVTSADLDGDGVRDLAVANRASSSVSVLLGVGDGTFAAKSDFATAPARAR